MAEMCWEPPDRQELIKCYCGMLRDAMIESAQCFDLQGFADGPGERRSSLSSTCRHKRLLSPSLRKRMSGEECGMMLKKLPLETWIVVDSPRYGWNVVSTHATQDEAEGERDKRNEGLSRVEYSACIVIEPVAQGMGRSCR